MMTQKDLLSEGFLDSIRRGAAKTLGGAIGGVVGAAKQVAKDVAAADTSASIFNVAKQGAKGMVSGYKAEAERQLASTPELFVEKELKTNWTKVFDPASIKITSKQNAAPMSHKSFRLSKVNKFFIYFEANRYKKQGGVELFKGNAAISRGSDGKFTLENIEDNNGQKIEKTTTIRRTQAQPAAQTPTQPAAQPAASKPKFYEALRDWKINNIGPNAVNNDLSYRQLRSFLTSIGIDDANTVLVLKNAGITGSGAQTISNSKLANLEASLKMIGITEKSQLNLLKQLNLLNDSYNKTYELSKY